MASKIETITEILESIKNSMCDNYCKYSSKEYQHSEDHDYYLNNEDSPCYKCPLNFI